MAFTFKVRLPQYRNASGVTVRIYEPGESTRMNGDEDDAMADTASDGLFLATVAEDEAIVGDFEYEVFRSGTAIQTGDLKRIAGQAVVLADSREDLIESIAAATSGGTNGTGQYQINITAAVGATAVRNVQVSIEGTDTFAYTGTLGTGTLNVDTGSYTLIVTPPAGYEGVANIPVTVGTADEPVVIALVATTVAVADAPYCATTLQVLSQYEGSAADVAVTIEFIKWLPDADPTGVVVNKLPAITSDTNGLVSANLFQLAKYKASYRVGFEEPKVVEFSTPAAGTYAVVDP